LDADFADKKANQRFLRLSASRLLLKTNSLAKDQIRGDSCLLIYRSSGSGKDSDLIHPKIQISLCSCRCEPPPLLFGGEAISFTIEKNEF